MTYRNMILAAVFTFALGGLPEIVAASASQGAMWDSYSEWIDEQTNDDPSICGVGITTAIGVQVPVDAVWEFVQGDPLQIRARWVSWEQSCEMAVPELMQHSRTFTLAHVPVVPAPTSTPGTLVPDSICGSDVVTPRWRPAAPKVSKDPLSPL